MPEFQKLFEISKGKPIEYEGRILQLVDYFDVSDDQQIKVIFESVKADWRQGIALTVDGAFIVNNQTIKNGIVLWHHTAPPVVSVQIKSKTGKCTAKNVWDTGDGTMHSWHNGAAMIVENTERGRRYLCNDGRADADFDDLVFRIEFK